MKQFFLTTALLMGISAGGPAWVSAETTPAPNTTKPPAAHVHQGDLGMSMGMGMMGGGMGMGMMGGLCPIGMGGPDTKVDVKNIDKGVTITITATDAGRVARLQKMAEAMRLMHEATAP
jgi:hypothetical protein